MTEQPDRYMKDVDVFDYGIKMTREETPDQLKRIADFMMGADAPDEVSVELEDLPKAIQQDAKQVWQVLYDGPAYRPATARDVVAVALATDMWRNGGPNRVTVVEPTPPKPGPASWTRGKEGKLEQKWDFLQEPENPANKLSPTQKLVEAARALRIEAAARAAAKPPPPKDDPVMSVSGKGSARFGETWDVKVDASPSTPRPR
ncbi:MAG: hypothetical protein Alpg2KO_20910 [Alphaproteobacteria bacterium]